MPVFPNTVTCLNRWKLLSDFFYRFTRDGGIVANKMRTILCLLVVVCAVKASVMGDFMDWEVSQFTPKLDVS